MFNKEINTLWLDCDGVLADFNLSARLLMDGMEPEDFEKKYGSNYFWEVINSDPNFFYNLELMQDAMFLYETVKHLKPHILTGVPKNMDQHSNQKILWVEKNFGLDQSVTCCQASKKSVYCKTGDILIDDRTIYKHKWEKAGGTYIVHTSALNSLYMLKQLKVI